jgi:hypothetical protein
MVGWEPFLYAWSAPNNIVRAMALETVPISEVSLLRVTGRTRVRNELHLPIVESVTRQENKNRIATTETVAISEQSLTRSKGFSKIMETETVPISEDSLTRQTTKSRAISLETVPIDESVVKFVPLVRALATETVAIAEVSLTKVKGIVRGITEVLAPRRSYTDLSYTALSYSLVSMPFNNETLTRVKSALRIIPTEVSLIAESITRLKSGQSSSAFSMAEAIPIGEGVPARVTAKTRVNVENLVPVASYTPMSYTALSYRTVPVTMHGTVSRTKDATRTLTTETVEISEAVLMMRGIVRVLATETVEIGEAIAKQLAKSRTLIENLATGEGIVRSLSKIRTIVLETVPISEAVEMLADNGAKLVRSIVEDAIIIGESVTRQLDRSRIITETVGIIENMKAWLNDVELVYIKPIIPNKSLNESFARFPVKTVRQMFRL